MAGSIAGIFGDLGNPTDGPNIRMNPATMPTPLTPQQQAAALQARQRSLMMSQMLMNMRQQQPQATTPAQSLANGLNQMGGAWWMNRMMHPDTANQPGAQNPTQPQTPTGVMPTQQTGPNSTATTPSGLPVSIGPMNIPFGMGGSSSLMDTKGLY